MHIEIHMSPRDLRRLSYPIVDAIAAFGGGVLAAPGAYLDLVAATAGVEIPDEVREQIAQFVKQLQPEPEPTFATPDRIAATSALMPLLDALLGAPIVEQSVWQHLVEAPMLGFKEVETWALLAVRRLRGEDIDVSTQPAVPWWPQGLAVQFPDEDEGHAPPAE